ncbi:hypothetical protein LTR66_017451, partial [Elasticomyces elasticus]
MLAEILLSLSGISSPIWQQLDDKPGNSDDNNFIRHVSPPERALLGVLEELASLHVVLRKTTTSISETHISTICRAIGTRITQRYLREFTDKIVEVEKSILQEDAEYVGAYKIVPLSTIVTQFQPWVRKLRWLEKTVHTLHGRGGSGAEHSQGTRVLAYLEKESHTGYTDIGDMSSDLLTLGQRAWVQALMPWIFYGKLPSVGIEEFLINKSDINNGVQYALRESSIPYFAIGLTAETILDIGKALNQIRDQKASSGMASTSSRVCNMILPASLRTVQALSYRLNSNDLSRAVTFISESISEAALSHLLPIHRIYDFLQVAQEYLLFGSGEFSGLLIEHIQEKVNSMQDSQAVSRPVRKLGQLDDLMLQTGDLNVILDKTWSDMSFITS